MKHPSAPAVRLSSQPGASVSSMRMAQRLARKRAAPGWMSSVSAPQSASMGGPLGGVTWRDIRLPRVAARGPLTVHGQEFVLQLELEVVDVRDAQEGAHGAGDAGALALAHGVADGVIRLELRAGLAE